MKMKITWVSDDKMSKKGKAYRSLLVENDEFRAWSFVMLPSDLKKGDEVEGRFDFCGHNPQFLIRT